MRGVQDLVGFSEASWFGSEPTWEPWGKHGLRVEAPGGCDRFHDPVTGRRVTDSPALLTRVPTAATLVARASVAFRATFDAAVLMVYERDDAWAKLCLERAPDGRHMVVSVVTRGASDDANGWCVDSSSLWLRVSRVDRAFAFHASTDAVRWDLVRLFALDRGDVVHMGLSVQAPIGTGCTATFEHVALHEGAIAYDDVRSGR